MYTLNTVPLHQPTSSLGWVVTSETQWTAGTSITRPELTIPGFDGEIGFEEMNAVEDVPVISVVIVTPNASHQKLRALLRSERLELSTSNGYVWFAQIQKIEEEPAGMGETPDMRVSVIFRLPGIWGRDAEVTTTETVLDTATKTVTAFSGLTGKVGDAILRIAGPATGLKISDSARSTVAYAPEIPEGSFLRFESTTGRAWVTTSDAWTGGTEVTDDVVGGPGPYAFRIIPAFNADMTMRGKLTVVTATRGASTIFALRGRAAYTL